MSHSENSAFDKQMGVCGELVNCHRGMLEIIDSRINEFNEMKLEAPVPGGNTGDARSPLTFKTFSKRKSSDDSFDYGSVDFEFSDGEGLGLINRSLDFDSDTRSGMSSSDLDGYSGRNQKGGVGYGSLMKQKGGSGRLSNKKGVGESGNVKNKTSEGEGGNVKKKRYVSLLKKRRKKKGVNQNKNNKGNTNKRTTEVKTILHGQENEKASKKKKKPGFVMRYAGKGGKMKRNRFDDLGSPNTPGGVSELVDQIQNLFNMQPGEIDRTRRKKRKRKRKKRDSVNLEIESVRKDLDYLKKVKERNELRILLINQQIQENQTEKQLILEKDEHTEADRKKLQEIEETIEEKKESLHRVIKENEVVKNKMKDLIDKFEYLVQKKSKRLKMKYIVKYNGISEETELKMLKKELDNMKNLVNFAKYPYEMPFLLLKDTFHTFNV